MSDPQEDLKSLHRRVLVGEYLKPEEYHAVVENLRKGREAAKDKTKETRKKKSADPEVGKKALDDLFANGTTQAN